jgi:dihydrofolate synthase/folylpolyglutamate synthase
MSDDAYLDALEFLYSRLNYERSGFPRVLGELRIGRTRRLLRLLGDPQDGLCIVHVAGTKGKGSTSALVAAALSASGLRTGLFTSPHLHRLEERFQIDGAPIAPQSLVALVDRLRTAVATIDATEPHLDGRPLTFFEITTALGLLHFAEAGARAVVLEVGVGGRLDSTNAVRPSVGVITSISFDHTKLLGSTLEAIATEKAGILKRGGRVIVGVRGGEAREAIGRVSRVRRCRARWIDEDYRERYWTPEPPLVRPAAGRVAVWTWRREWGPIELPLLGRHQAVNATTALAALDAWSEAESTAVAESAVVRGWSGLRFPARVELVSERPWLFIDGAHNVASAEALTETLAHHVPPGPRTLVFGTTRDKDLPGQLRALLPHFDRVVATRYRENPRATPIEDVAACASGQSDLPVTLAEDPAAALELARSFTPDDGVICVTGSLFLAAEARAVALGLPASPRPRVPV